MRPQTQSNDNWLNRSKDFQASTKCSDKEIMEILAYMGFFPFSKFLFVSNLVSLGSESRCFHPENVCRNLNKCLSSNYLSYFIMYCTNYFFLLAVSVCSILFIVFLMMSELSGFLKTEL